VPWLIWTDDMSEAMTAIGVCETLRKDIGRHALCIGTAVAPGDRIYRAFELTESASIEQE
jgi:hypothetical protein